MELIDVEAANLPIQNEMIKNKMDFQWNGHEVKRIILQKENPSTDFDEGNAVAKNQELWRRMERFVIKITGKKINVTLL